LRSWRGEWRKEEKEERRKEKERREIGDGRTDLFESLQRLVLVLVLGLGPALGM
jgi:hypothetical protein